MAGVLERWKEKEDEKIEKKEKENEKKAIRVMGVCNRIDKIIRNQAFRHWREVLKLTYKDKYEKQLKEERERRLISEASLSALQVELREALDRIAKLEKKEQKRIQRKKKRIQKKRQDHMNGEASRSLTIEETPLKNESELFEEIGSHEKRDEAKKNRLEGIFENKKMRKSAFPPDQRGSVNTEMRQRRLKNRLLTHRGSVAVSSVYSQARTEFSFHPTINHDNKWRPKYDDHYNHKKMWKRMHKENEKISMKKRMMSEQRDAAELAKCTFTPDLVSKKSYKDKNKNDEPLNVKHLSLRLYQYADKFKEKREQMKEKYEHQRGEEIRFTPILETTNNSKLRRTLNDRKDVYETLYEDHQKRELKKKRKSKSKQRSRKTINNSNDMYLTVKKPGSKGSGSISYYKAALKTFDKRSGEKSSNTPEHKHFSSSIYASSSQRKEEI